jgi:hypothetical protein
MGAWICPISNRCAALIFVLYCICFRSTVAGFLLIEIWSLNPTLKYLRLSTAKIENYRHEITLPGCHLSVLPAPAADQEQKNSFVDLY